VPADGASDHESEQESNEVRTVCRKVRTAEEADAVVATAETVAVA
jgi:hypothetical protein